MLFIALIIFKGTRFFNWNVFNNKLICSFIFFWFSLYLWNCVCWLFIEHCESWQTNINLNHRVVKETIDTTQRIIIIIWLQLWFIVMLAYWFTLMLIRGYYACIQDKRKLGKCLTHFVYFSLISAFLDQINFIKIRLSALLWCLWSFDVDLKCCVCSSKSLTYVFWPICLSFYLSANFHPKKKIITKSTRMTFAMMHLPSYTLNNQYELPTRSGPVWCNSAKKWNQKRKEKISTR